jgi:dTDP-L-rhamnose 4-epimerase
VARAAARGLGVSHIQPEITRKGRVGDIRHCFADIRLASRVLGYKPGVTLAEGIVEVAEWVAGQTATDRVSAAGAELAVRGLTL